jgi:hypothetical protein
VFDSGCGANPNGSNERYACRVMRERWKPSLAWRVVMVVHFAASVGFCYLVMRFFFPPVFLLPVVVGFAALAFACCVAPLEVLLDPSAGELATTFFFFWTKHVPLAQVKSVKELPFGFEIETAGSPPGSGWWTGYEFGAGNRFSRSLKRLLRIRTGFEGMEQAVAQAIVTVRAASSESADPENAASQPGLLVACIFCGAGLFALAVAVAVQPQAGVWIVHALAWLLRIYFGAAGFVVILLGAWFLYSALRDRRDVRWLG